MENKPEIQHTFLLTPGTWSVKGLYFDETEKSVTASGEIIIKHEDENWVTEQTIKLTESPEPKLTNTYNITPIKENGKVAKWKAGNELLGQLIGSYMLQEEYIISLFETEDKKYSGTEYFIYVDDERYRNRGVLFEGDKKLFSWTVELVKVN